MDEKIQKLLASYGLASRREIERWIEAGRITINGEPAHIGARVTSKDQIKVDGKLVHSPDQQSIPRALVYNKPVDEICTRHDPEGRPTVFKRLPRLIGERWIMVGRLDINSSGLLLFTNFGELAHRLMHPRYEIAREYAVRVLGNVSEETLATLKKGVQLDDGLAKFVTIIDAGGQGANHWYHVALKEGRNREVRRMWEAVGHTVSRLHRIRFGPVRLPRVIKPGHFEELDPVTMELLLKEVGLQREEIVQRPTQRRAKQNKRVANKRKKNSKKKYS